MKHRDGRYPAAGLSGLHPAEGSAPETVGRLWLCWVMDSTSALALGERGVEETLDAVEVLWLEALEGNCEIFLMADMGGTPFQWLRAK